MLALWLMWGKQVGWYLIPSTRWLAPNYRSAERTIDAWHQKERNVAPTAGNKDAWHQKEKVAGTKGKKRYERMAGTGCVKKCLEQDKKDDWHQKKRAGICRIKKDGWHQKKRCLAPKRIDAWHQKERNVAPTAGNKDAWHQIEKVAGTKGKKG